MAADLTDPAQLDHLVDRAGAVDVLVINAGFSWFGPTAELDVATFDRLFAANVRAAYFLVAALAPKIAAQGNGSTMSFGSMAGQIGLAGGAAYSATNTTLAATTPFLGGRVQVLRYRGQCSRSRTSPDQWGRRDRIGALGATTLLARAAQPGESAFLASPKASYITGPVIAADGGRTAI